MRYSAPLLTADAAGNPIISADPYALLTNAQIARLAQWSIDLEKTVFEVLVAFNPMARQIGDSDHVELTGNLPGNPRLFCGLQPDGSVHT